MATHHVRTLTPPELELVAGSRRAILVTTAVDGTPRPVPICFVIDHGSAGAVRVVTPIDEKPKRSSDPRDLARVRDILAVPRVAVLVDRWDEDWTRLAWVRLIGTAQVIEPPAAAHRSAVQALRAKYQQYADQRLEERPMISIEIERVVSWGDVTSA